ncbi:TPA: TauD/TfdA family dioxygenase [Pseudomonas aeruginosa]|nr:TauD/TfdA family dioxygenase [Pseudomonas aeruginosa]
MSNAAQALAPPVRLDVRPVAGRIGAEIRGVTLSGELDAATVEAIQAALVRHKVIFFRDQSHLDDQTQEAFAHLLGEPVAHPTVPSREGTRFLLELDGAEGRRANSWHTDVTFVEAYPKASILRSVVAPESGGDTVWANTASAYADLPAELRELADRLWAVHSNEYDYAGVKPSASLEQLENYRKVFTSTVYETEHPLVRTHPESGRRVLFLSAHTEVEIPGYDPARGQALIGRLREHLARPELSYSHAWSVGDIVWWDNQAVLHARNAFPASERRRLKRISLAGSRPF